jgi:magnesium chelatase family protein
VGVLGGEPGAGWRPPPAPAERRFDPGDEPLDFADVRGQEGAKRALVIAAAGGHNVIFAGPPGAGKTMLARRLPTILPDLDLEESFEVTRIASVAGILPPGVGLVRTPPFRAPHHTASEAALVGGGNPVRPGEVTLAHRGVLFLDELPEFGIHKLDTLRQPLEEGCVRIARSSGTIEFPADFICVAAMNPCPCGHAFQEARPCRCPPPTIRRYQSRISGPLRDRFDLQVVLRPVKAAALHGAPAGPSSTELRDQVVRAREAQAARMGRAGARTNAKLSGPAFRRVARVRPDADAAMRAAAEEFRFSARRMGKLLRVARTIADLEGSEDVLCDHVDEALTFRGLEVDLQLETVS